MPTRRRSGPIDDRPRHRIWNAVRIADVPVTLERLSNTAVLFFDSVAESIFDKSLTDLAEDLTILTPKIFTGIASLPGLLGLNARRGDIAIREDTAVTKTYFLSNYNPAAEASWVELPRESETSAVIPDAPYTYMGTVANLQLVLANLDTCLIYPISFFLETVTEDKYYTLELAQFDFEITQVISRAEGGSGFMHVVINREEVAEWNIVISDNGLFNTATPSSTVRVNAGEELAVVFNDIINLNDVAVTIRGIRVFD